MSARPRSVYHDSRYFLLHDQAVADIEAEVELGESAFEVERMVSLRQWIEHHTHAVSDPEVPSRLPAMTIKQRQLHNASTSSVRRKSSPVQISVAFHVHSTQPTVTLVERYPG